MEVVRDPSTDPSLSRGLVALNGLSMAVTGLVLMARSDNVLAHMAWISKVLFKCIFIKSYIAVLCLMVHIYGYI
jgi:hypothetical protein